MKKVSFLIQLRSHQFCLIIFLPLAKKYFKGLSIFPKNINV